MNTHQRSRGARPTPWQVALAAGAVVVALAPGTASGQESPPALPPASPPVESTAAPTTAAPPPPATTAVPVTAAAPVTTAAQSAPAEPATTAATPPGAASKARPATTKAQPAAGKATTTTAPAGGRAKRNKAGQYLPNGRAHGPATPFDWGGAAAASQAAAASSVQRAAPFVVVLVIGSDARPKENAQRSRGDSVQLVMWNQALGKGTILGIPRDTWVPIQGRGESKINASLTWGGPELMRSSVANFTGIPVDRWIVTGFDGFTKLINDLGGINVQITTSMNDPYSGAQFAPGWFAMNGDAALALVRNRKSGVPGGDVGRSRNQGVFLLDLLSKSREQTRTSRDLAKWVSAAQKFTTTNASVAELGFYALLGRNIDPANLSVVVLPVENAKIGKTDAQRMLPTGTALLADLRTDGVVNGK
jgi:polyisoprenyl-teichoic acid--peptidoglycan teichoic acid transferase